MVILAVIAAMLLAGVLLMSYYAYRVTFYSPKDHEEKIFDLPTGEQYDSQREVVHRCVRALNEVPCEEVSIRSFDGKRLCARYYHHMDGAPVQIMFHGYRGSAIRDFCGGAVMARKLGHNALIVDQRAHGRSQGSTITFGVLERFDCKSWAEYVQERFGDVPIVLSGVSMGAATVLMASELDLPETVTAILADCPFSSPREIIAKVAGEMGLPGKPAAFCCELGALLFGHFWLGASSAESAVKKAKVPILLIHGLEDRFVPCEMSRRIRAACAGECEFYTFPNAAHAFSYMTDPQHYETLTMSFLNRHVG